MTGSQGGAIDRRLATLAFASGFISLSLELIAARMLAPFFGNSVYVWGCVLGMFLAGISLGYFLGGRVADSWHDSGTLFFITAIASVLLLGIGAVYPYVLGFLWRLGEVGGSLIAVGLLFGLPVVLLSMVPPYLVRMRAEKQTEGGVVGAVFALSTAGSIVGTFITAFALIPHLGTRLTLYAITIPFLACVILALGSLRHHGVLLLASLLILVPAGPAPSTGWEVLYEKDSPYNFIQVRTDGNIYTLRLDRADAMHSVIGANTTSTAHFYDYALLGPMLIPTKEVLILGAGAGTMVRQILERVPDARVEAVEIDPAVIEVAQRFFGVNASDPRLVLHTGDARSFVRRTQKDYDLIVLDVYNGGLQVPFHVMTLEFFREVKGTLNTPGILVVNAISMNYRGERDYSLAQPIASTLGKVFAHVYALDYDSNTLLYASDQELHLSAVMTKPLIEREKREYALSHFREMETAGGHVFTDDRSDIEQLTHEMIGVRPLKN